MVLGVLCFMGLGIASAAYAARWGKPPKACAEYDTYLTLTTGDEDADVCDTNILSITTSFQSVSFERSLQCIVSWPHVHCRCLGFLLRRNWSVWICNPGDSLHSTAVEIHYHQHQHLELARKILADKWLMHKIFKRKEIIYHHDGSSSCIARHLCVWFFEIPRCTMFFVEISSKTVALITVCLGAQEYSSILPLTRWIFLLADLILCNTSIWLSEMAQLPNICTCFFGLISRTHTH